LSNCRGLDRRLPEGSRILLEEQAICGFSIKGRVLCCVVAGEARGEDVVARRDDDNEEKGYRDSRAQTLPLAADAGLKGAGRCVHAKALFFPGYKK
jgi:hypothetical protein